MTSINNLFHALINNQITESFSGGNFIFLLAIFVVCYFLLKFIFDVSSWFIFRENVGRVICIIISLLVTLTFGRYTDMVNKHFIPVYTNYATTQPAKADQAITDINKDYPYFLKIIPSDDNVSIGDTTNEYFVFSKTTNQIKNIHNKLTSLSWIANDNLIFLKPDKSTVIVKATYDAETNAIEKYEIMKKSVGLKIKNWDANYKNTSQLKLNDFKLTDNN